MSDNYESVRRVLDSGRVLERCNLCAFEGADEVWCDSFYKSSERSSLDVFEIDSMRTDLSRTLGRSR